MRCTVHLIRSWYVYVMDSTTSNGVGRKWIDISLPFNMCELKNC